MTGWHVTGPPGSKAPAGGVQSLSGLSASAAVADGGLVLPAAADLDPALLPLRFGRLGQSGLTVKGKRIERAKLP
jgi:hypothetical protein